MLTILFAISLFTPADSLQPRFEAQTIDSTLAIGYGLALGDVDGDGRTDILLADKKQFVWYRNGDWKRFVMAENLTESDNVCIAARDLDGDGKVEVGVGAQWNPGETTDSMKSGSVHFLRRPADPTQPWQPVRLKHEPTVHRMRWLRTSAGKYYLAVLPLHGRGNRGGEGAGVNLLVFGYPELLHSDKPLYAYPTGMHLTHNLEVLDGPGGGSPRLCIAGKEGLRLVDERFHSAPMPLSGSLPAVDSGAGEVRIGRGANGQAFAATIEPMHGRRLVVYEKGRVPERKVIDEDLAEGHALATADLLGRGRDGIVAGWRQPNREGVVGVRLYLPQSDTTWTAHWIDRNGMACEDLQVADLDGDGRPDIIASGRATRNLKIYWNRSSATR